MFMYTSIHEEQISMLMGDKHLCLKAQVKMNPKVTAANY